MKCNFHDLDEKRFPKYSEKNPNKVLATGCQLTGKRCAGEVNCILMKVGEQK